MIINCSLVADKSNYLPHRYVNQLRYPMSIEELKVNVNYDGQVAIVSELLNENTVHLGIDGQYIQMHVIGIGRKIELGDMLFPDNFDVKMQVREIVKI